MILIGIILIFLGMGAYMINNSKLVSNDWFPIVDSWCTHDWNDNGWYNVVLTLK